LGASSRFACGEDHVGIERTPKDTPVEIIAKLNEGINAALADPKMKARLADLSATPLPGSPADFGKLIAAETEKWGKVIRAANIKAEQRFSVRATLLYRIRDFFGIRPPQPPVRECFALRPAWQPGRPG
jgi:hypothetical protein